MWTRTGHTAEEVVEVPPEAKNLVPVFHHRLCQLRGLLEDPRRHAVALATAAGSRVMRLVRWEDGAVENHLLRQNRHYELHSSQRLSVLGQQETGYDGCTTGVGEGPAKRCNAENLHVVPGEGHTRPPALPVNLVQEVGTI